MRFTSQVVKFALFATCVASLSSCTFLDTFVPKKDAKTDVIDRTKNLTVDDYRDLSEIDKVKAGNDEPIATAALGAPPIPDEIGRAHV